MPSARKSTWSYLWLFSALSFASCGDDDPAGTNGASAQAGAGGADAAGAPGSAGAQDGLGGEGGSGQAGSGQAGSGEGGTGVAVACGNGLVDGDEECERLVGCGAGERCSAECACVPAEAVPPSSQELIERALQAGDIDYPTSLMYRVWALYQAPELPEAYDGTGSQGEDTYLFFELSRFRASLPPNIETEIAPYLVRPNDPASVFSQPPVAPLGGPQPTSVYCPLDDVGQPDWRAVESTNFKVWSCGGGVGGTDPHAARRDVAAALAEQVYLAMEPTLGAPRPDDDEAPPAKPRTDIYILDLNQCRTRDGSCTPIDGEALAAASPTTPCGRDQSGPLHSSAYLVLGAAHVPVSMPVAGTPSKLRYNLAHEYFHAVSFNLNLEAQGGTCVPVPDLPPEEARSWLTEASAEWASFVFFKADGAERRNILFERYQRYRDSSTQGLHESLGSLPYQAFLYPLFVQEENNALPDKMLQFWTTSQNARKIEDLDNHLNATLDFAEHFRDFAARNFNRNFPGKPVPKPHSDLDMALTFDQGFASFVPEPSLELQAPVELYLPLPIAPLAAQTEHYYLNDAVRSVRIDASDVPNMEHLSLDAMVKAGNEWRRERVSGPIYEFCREDGESNDINEFFLIFSNFDRTRSGKIAGDYQILARNFCPGGWHGMIRVVQTLDEHSSESFAGGGSSVVDRREREEQRWTVVGTSLYSPPGFPPGFENERMEMQWSGLYSRAATTESTNPPCGTSVTTESVTGSGSDTTFFDALATGPGTFTLQPSLLGLSYPGERVSTVNNCDGGSITSSGSQTFPEAVSYLIQAMDLMLLTEDPTDPGHFAGSASVLHTEEPLPGGERILDITVDWSLRRVVER